MNLKTYNTIRLVIVFLLAMLVSQSMISHNYLLPIKSIIIATLVLAIIRKQVKEVIVDERDYAIGGQAALISIQIFSWLSVIIMFVLFAKQGSNPMYGVIASFLSYSVLLLLSINALVAHFYSRVKIFKKPISLLFVFLLAALIATASYWIF